MQTGPEYQVIPVEGPQGSLVLTGAISDSGFLAGVGLYSPDDLEEAVCIAPFSLAPRVTGGKMQYMAIDIP